MTTVMYLIEVVTNNVQMISDSMPKATAGGAARHSTSFEGVKRARADVAVDNTERAQHKGAQTPGRGTGLAVGDSGFDRHHL